LDKRLRVAINAQVRSNSGSGGIATVLAELTALGQLDDGTEEYVFIGPWDEPDWLQPLLNSRQRIVRGPKSRSAESFKRSLGPLRPVARHLKSFLTQAAETNAGVPTSDGFYESLQCNVIHFPFQTFVRCELPTVYNPHDLQHLHYPEFFDRSTVNWRETAYPSACRAAHTVVVTSEFVKQDIVRHYKVSPEKIQVIHWAPPPAALAPASHGVSFAAVNEKYALPERPFALYPAMTWEHKNHLRLLEALAYLRDRRALRLNLVCTGHRTDFWPRIERRMSELGLQEQVKFVGLVSYDELRVIYRAAQFVIIPTLFEAASAPLFEAWQQHVPVACASVTSLPEQAADAALFFNPLSVEAIADAVARMAVDDELRANLQRRGDARLQSFSLERTAKMYRAVYRRAAGQSLSEEDRWLLSAGQTGEAATKVGATG
jgi:glycosyltransferase involved in cell wall biosynthesis